MRHEIYLKLATKLYFPVASYFRFFARIVLKRWKPRTVVVMGSAGKSNAHNLLYLLISKKTSIRRSEKANSAFAIPLDVLNIHLTRYTPGEWLWAAIKVPFLTLYLWLKPYKEKYYILELDVDRPGEMAFFASFIKPKLVFWVSSYATHTENFERLVSKGGVSTEAQAIANEFAKIFGRSHRTVAIVNNDSQYIKEAMKKYEVVKYPIKKDTGRYAFSAWQIFRKRTTMQLKLGTASRKVELPFIAPRNFGYTVLAAAIVAKILEIPEKDWQQTLSEYSFNPGICSVLEGINESKIIDSSYNSSFYATKSLLEVLMNFPGKRKIAVLGDMRELGALSQAEHEKLADELLRLRPDQVVLVGPEMNKYVYPRLSALYSDLNLHIFQNTYQAGLFIKERLIKAGDVVLLKASQNTLFFEIIAELLLKNPEDTSLLARRLPVWQLKRNQIKEAFYRQLSVTA